MSNLRTYTERIRDAFDGPEDLLEHVDVSFNELIELLFNNGYINQYTLPFIFNGDEYGEEAYEESNYEDQEAYD